MKKILNEYMNTYQIDIYSYIHLIFFSYKWLLGTRHKTFHSFSPVVYVAIRQGWFLYVQFMMAVLIMNAYLNNCWFILLKKFESSSGNQHNFQARQRAFTLQASGSREF